MLPTINDGDILIKKKFSLGKSIIQKGIFYFDGHLSNNENQKEKEDRKQDKKDDTHILELPSPDGKENLITIEN